MLHATRVACHRGVLEGAPVRPALAAGVAVALKNMLSNRERERDKSRKFAMKVANNSLYGALGGDTVLQCYPLASLMTMAARTMMLIMTPVLTSDPRASGCRATVSSHNLSPIEGLESKNQCLLYSLQNAL